VAEAQATPGDRQPPLRLGAAGIAAAFLASLRPAFAMNTPTPAPVQCL